MLLCTIVGIIILYIFVVVAYLHLLAGMPDPPEWEEIGWEYERSR